MFKYWIRKVGLPLVVALVVALVAVRLDNQVFAFVSLAAVLWAAAGARDYRVYRNARVRAEASRDARAAFRG